MFQIRLFVTSATTLFRLQIVDAQHTSCDIKRGQNEQAAYYDRAVSDKEALEDGDTVRLQPVKMGRKDWSKGTVVKRLDERSHVKDTPTGVVRRNSQQLNKTTERPRRGKPPSWTKTLRDKPHSGTKCIKNKTFREHTTEDETPHDKTPDLFAVSVLSMRGFVLHSQQPADDPETLRSTDETENGEQLATPDSELSASRTTPLLERAPLSHQMWSNNQNTCQIESIWQNTH